MVVRVLEVLPHSSTSPAVVEIADGTRRVMKFSGSGPGPCGLLTEFLALRIAAACGAPVPSAAPLWLPEGMPWQVGTDEFDSMLQRSWGWNLGISLIPGARPVPVSEIGGFAPADLDAIARADAILQNVDRTARNPNLLQSRGGLWAIDYDACLYLARALGPPRTPVRTLPAGHLMAGRGDEVIPPEIDADALAAAAPAAWVDSAGTSRADLADALARYFAA